MVKKISRLIAIVLVVAMALTGCMTANVTTTINSDASGKVEFAVDFEKDIIDKFAEKAGVSNISDLFGGYKYTIVSKEGKEYYELKQSQNVTPGSMSAVLSSSLATDFYTTMDTVYGQFNTQKIVFDGISFDELVAMYKLIGTDVSNMKFIFAFEFASPIVSTTGVIDKDNPNRVSFELTYPNFNATIFATTNSSETLQRTKSIVKQLNSVNKVKITKVKVNKSKTAAKRTSATLKIKKVKEASAYQVQYSTNKKFKGKKSKTFKKTTLTIKNLKKGKKYFIRVRACRMNYAGTTVYSKWVNKTIKIKK